MEKYCHDVDVEQSCYSKTTTCAIIRADPEICEGGVSHLRFLSPSPLPYLFSSPLHPALESVPLKPAGGFGSDVSSPSGVRAEPWPRTNFVHSNAVEKLLVAITLNILSTMFYSRKIKI